VRPPDDLYQAEAECICGCTVYARDGVSLEQARDEKAEHFARLTEEHEKKSEFWAVRMAPKPAKKAQKVNKRAPDCAKKTDKNNESEENGVKSEQKQAKIKAKIKKTEAKINEINEKYEGIKDEIEKIGEKVPKIDQLKNLLNSFGMDDLADLPYPVICAMRKLKKVLDK